MAYIDKSMVAERHIGRLNRHAATGIPVYSRSNITVSGTCTPTCAESQIVTGGRTIILTLNIGKWIPAGTLFDAARTAIRTGIDSAQAEAAGFDARKATLIPLANVVRTNSKVVTITLAADAGYSIAVASEVVTVTVPYAAIEYCKSNVIATPIFTIVLNT
jgi:hypothetical protein